MVLFPAVHLGRFFASHARLAMKAIGARKHNCREWMSRFDWNKSVGLNKFVTKIMKKTELPLCLGPLAASLDLIVSSISGESTVGSSSFVCSYDTCN
jgi:hypothetical protein